MNLATFSLVPPPPPSMNSEKSNSGFLEINVQWGSALVLRSQIFEHSSNYFTIWKITKMLLSQPNLNRFAFCKKTPKCLSFASVLPQFLSTHLTSSFNFRKVQIWPHTFPLCNVDTLPSYRNSENVGQIVYLNFMTSLTSIKLIIFSRNSDLTTTIVRSFVCLFFVCVHNRNLSTNQPYQLSRASPIIANLNEK